jgi:hypothetical protein
VHVYFADGEVLPFLRKTPMGALKPLFTVSGAEEASRKIYCCGGELTIDVAAPSDPRD